MDFNFEQEATNVNVKLKPIAISLGAVLLLAGCSVSPEPTTPAERQGRVARDQTLMFVRQEKISRPLAFSDVLARAYAYNLEHRLKLMEDALAEGQLDLAYYDMLPRLTAAAGYNSRNNDPGGTALNLRTGVVGTDVSVAQERQHHTEQLSISWNMLDFGLSYVRAKQQANQVLIAEERRRKTLQNITQDVLTAYWRAVAAQRHVADVERLLTRAEEAMRSAQTIEKQRLMPPMQVLVYQRGLIEIVQQLRARRADLEMARTELAALMNLRPGTRFSLADPGQVPMPAVPAYSEVTRLEDVALLNRAELREEDYRARNNLLDARRNLLSVLPAIQVETGLRYDSNKYLYNNGWMDSGINLSFNLLRAFSLPAVQRQQALQSEVDDMRRMATTMAVLAQVRIATEQYRQAVQDYQLTQQLDSVDQRIKAQMTAAVKSASETELELIRVDVRAVLSGLQRDYAHASMQSAYARLLNSLGADLSVADSGRSLQDLKAEIETRLKEWNVNGVMRRVEAER